MDSTPNLTLYDPQQHYYERWPEALFTRCAVAGLTSAGEQQELVFYAEWRPILAYVLPIEDVLWGGRQVPSPMPDTSALTAATLAAARQAGADALACQSVRMYDGYYYDPAAYVVRTWQEDRAAAIAQCPNFEALATNRMPAAPVTV